MKRLAIVLGIMSFIAILGSIIYTSLFFDIENTAKSGDIQKLEIQLKANKDKDSVYRALNAAIVNKNVSAVKVLLDYIEDPNYIVSNSMESTSLELAVYFGNKDIVNMLIDKGADVNSKNIAGAKLLRTAIINKQYSIASILIDRGADVSDVDYFFTGLGSEKEDEKSVERLVRIAAENTDTAKREQIKTFFEMAVLTNNYKLLDFLIEKYKEDNYLDEALGKAIEVSNTGMVDYIAGKGTEIGKESTYSDLVKLMIIGKTDTIKHVISKQGLISEETGKGIFLRLLEYDQLDLIRFILENGYDLSKFHEGKNTPIFAAIRRCNSDAVKLLIDYNAPIGGRDFDGKDVFEATEYMRKNLDWFDFGHKKELDKIYKMLRDYSDK